jgi:uncharacterized protein
MRIVIAGGSGFLGTALTESLLAAHHRVHVLTRRPGHTAAPGTDRQFERISWTPDGTAGPWAPACAGADVIVNLAGESIGAGRWTSARKAQLRGSRLLATRSLARFIAEAEQPPATFISASAVGFYGDRADDMLAEDDGPGQDFLAKLAVAWEHDAMAAEGDRTRVVLLRSGIVLDPREGALGRMLTPFQLYVGGPFGSGRQYMSWIHRGDWVSLVRWAIETPAIRGPLNLVSPNPVINADFARALGRMLHRPAFVQAPGAVLKLVLGEMAGPLLLYSQRVRPARALEGGFHFEYPTLDEALVDLLRPSTPGA